MKELDIKLKKINDKLEILEHRTKVENKAVRLIGEGKYTEAIELLNTLDDSLLEV